MYVDIHSHIIPDIDDGAIDRKMALEMLKMAWNNGTGHIVATPHYIHGNSRFDFSQVSERCKDLQQLAANNNLNISIHTGCEVFLSPDLPELYENGSIFTINQTSYMLIELPMEAIPLYTDNVLFRLQLKGVIPVLAHPERNRVIIRNPSILNDMVSRGIIAQVNSGSITGIYGHTIHKTSMRLIKMGMVQLVGSDAHTCNGRSPILDEAAKIVEKKFGQDTMIKIFINNGLALLKDEQFQPKRLKDRIKSKTINNKFLN